MYMEKKQSNRSGFKILRLTAIYATVAFAICFIILFNLDSSIVFAATSASPQDSITTVGANAAVNVTSSSGASAAPSAVKPAVTLTGVPADAQDIAFSHDDKYCTYMFGSQLIIKDLQTGSTVKTIASGGIIWPILMNDRNILMYFTVSGTTLALNTYNIDSSQGSKQTSFTFPSGAKIKAVDYSNATNLVYINFSLTKNGTETDSVYTVNIMKNLQKLSLTSTVDNMVLLSKVNSLYYNDAKNTLYLHGKPFTGVKTGKLLGRDVEDKVYIQSLSDSSTVYMIFNEKLDKTITLPDSNYSEFYTDKNSVYAVYSDYIINLSGDVTNKLQYDSGLKFLGMGGGNAYFRDAQGNIVGIKSSIG